MKLRLSILCIALFTLYPLKAGNVITYTASSKLPGVYISGNAGIHWDAFNVSATSHTFSEGIGTITFSGDVTSIGERAFYYCDAMTSITIPESVTTIGPSAFDHCWLLRSITIPSSVTEIGGAAFSHSGLRSITILGSVESMSIRTNAFYSCSSLSYIYCERMSPPTIDASTFPNYRSLLYIPCGSLENYVKTTWGNFTHIYEVNTLSYTVASNNDALGSVTELKKADCDHTLIVQAVPNTGCVFAGWNDGNKENPRTMVVTDGMNLTAIFQKGYAITVSQDCNVITE